MPQITSASNAIVTASQMQAIESRLFDFGMPIAALMEKVGLLLTAKLIEAYPRSKYPRISVLVGPGHNGGDAWVVARELWQRGYSIKVFQPLQKSKSLTQEHGSYGVHLGIPVTESIDEWLECDLILDGLFGFGLTRAIEGQLARWIEVINQTPAPVVSIDIPSGIHTDTGQILGTAIAASHTYCLGLWKRAFYQEQALNWIGQAELIPFGIPDQDQAAVLGDAPLFQTLTPNLVNPGLPRQRPVAVHKYQMGAALLVCGSRQYPGAAVIAAQAARASGVGMLYVAVPESLVPILVNTVPDAVIVGCPETSAGAIAALPEGFDFQRITAIAIGPGLSLDAQSVLDQLLPLKTPLILDADALNLIAKIKPTEILERRDAATILTPHWGEFQRLFEHLFDPDDVQRGDRLQLFQRVADAIPATIVLKGAKTLISGVDNTIFLNPESTPALARGGSGDVLTGLMAGLLAQNPRSHPMKIAATGVWWHAQAALLAESQVTSSGVSPTVLTHYLIPFLTRYGQTN